MSTDPAAGRLLPAVVEEVHGMRINRRWRRIRSRLATFGVRMGAKPLRVLIDGAVLKKNLARVYNTLYQSRRRALLRIF